MPGPSTTPCPEPRFLLSRSTDSEPPEDRDSFLLLFVATPASWGPWHRAALGRNLRGYRLGHGALPVLVLFWSLHPSLATPSVLSLGRAERGCTPPVPPATGILGWKETDGQHGGPGPGQMASAELGVPAQGWWQWLHTSPGYPRLSAELATALGAAFPAAALDFCLPPSASWLPGCSGNLPLTSLSPLTGGSSHVTRGHPLINFPDACCSREDSRLPELSQGCLSGEGGGWADSVLGSMWASPAAGVTWAEAHSAQTGQ